MFDNLCDIKKAKMSEMTLSEVIEEYHDKPARKWDEHVKKCNENGQIAILEEAPELRIDILCVFYKMSTEIERLTCSLDKAWDQIYGVDD